MAPDLEPRFFCGTTEVAVVADAEEAFRQDVNEPTADEFIDAEWEDVGGFGA